MKYHYFGAHGLAMTPNLRAWRYCLTEGTPCKVVREGILSIKQYTVVRLVDPPPGVPPWLPFRKREWAIVNNGDRDLKSPLPVTSLVPVNRTRA